MYYLKLAAALDRMFSECQSCSYFPRHPMLSLLSQQTQECRTVLIAGDTL